MDRYTRAQLKLLDKTINRLIKAYIDEYSSVLNEIKGLVLELYAKISVDEKPLLSHLYQYKRYYKLINEIQTRLTQLGVKQEEIFTKEMETFFQKNCAILNDQFERPFDDKPVLDMLKKELLDDSLWSESIWRDKAVLLNKVKHQLVMNVTMGKNIDKMAEDLQSETLTSNFYNAKRLCRQEVAKYYRLTTVEKYKQAGVDKVQWHAVMDDRTCQECINHNDEIMDIDKAPQGGWHIQCRCWITPVIE